MSHLQFFTYAGFGERAYYSQAVRHDNIVEISGQGGWRREADDIVSSIPSSEAEQVDLAFENVQHTLEQAGSKGWSEVYKVTVLMAPMTDSLMEEFKRCLGVWCPGHKPILTGYEVKGLAIPGMKVEIEVAAHVRQ